MDFQEITKRALEIRKKYSKLEKKLYGKEWKREQILHGLISDVGDLTRLIMAKEGVREIEEVDKKLAQQLADCLWATIVLADKYGVDLEKSFLENMRRLNREISKKLKA